MAICSSLKVLAGVPAGLGSDSSSPGKEVILRKLKNLPASIVISRRTKLSIDEGSEVSSTSLPDGRAVTRTLEALKSQNRKPRKALGQHYMVNDEVTQRTVEAAKIEQGDLVLEIGTGTGALSQALLDAGAQIIGVEKDPDMVFLCKDRFKRDKRVKIVEGDILRWPVYDSMLPYLKKRRDLEGNSNFRAKLVSNLPFNITTEVIEKFIPMGDIFSSITLMLQDETARRIIAAQPGSSIFREINIFVKYFTKPEYHFFVDRKCFLPAPQVHAAVVTFNLKLPSEYPPVSDMKEFFTMVNIVFNAKRKTLRRTLRPLFDSEAILPALEYIGLPPTARPEELSLEKFLRLFERLRETSQSKKIEDDIFSVTTDI